MSGADRQLSTERRPRNPGRTERTLGDQASSAVDSGRVELHELEILKGESSASDHSGSVSGASVGGGAGEVGASVTSSGEDGLVRAESVHGAVLLVVGHHSNALAVLHDEICRPNTISSLNSDSARGAEGRRTSGEVLDEVLGVVAERLAVESVEHGMSGSVGGSGATVGLSSLSVLERLSTERALVDLALLGAGEGESVVLELENGRSCDRRVSTSR